LKYAPKDTSLCSGRTDDVRETARSGRALTAVPVSRTVGAGADPGAGGTVLSWMLVCSST
jgi:hypothetical protein